MVRRYDRGANRSGYAGGSLEYYGLGYYARQRINHGRNIPKPPRSSKHFPKRVAKALGTAKGLMGSEKARKKLTAQHAEERAKHPAPGHKRIIRRDPVTGVTNTLDIKITQRQLDIVLRGRTLPSIPGWQLLFIQTGELKQEDEA